MSIPMNGAGLKQITAVSDNKYEVILEAGEDEYRILCTVSIAHGVPLV